MSAPRYLSPNELRLKMRMMPNFLELQKMLVIYTSMVDPRSPQEIARHTGLSESTVNRIIAEYNENGVESLKPSRSPLHRGDHRAFGAN